MLQHSTRIFDNMFGTHKGILPKPLMRKKRCQSTQSEQRPKRTSTLKGILAQNTDEFCKNTTLHGLRYITSEELYPTERLFFAISFVSVLLISTGLIFKVYQKWATSPVIFGIKPEPTFITNEPFPAVTICNLNQALKSKALVFSNHSTEYAMLRLLCKQKVNTTLADSITDWSGLERFILNISQPCESMIIGCRFGATEYNCSEIFHPIVTDEGLCCVFNMLHPAFMYVSHTPLAFVNLQTPGYTAVDWYAEQGYPPNLPKYFYPRTTPGTGESLGLSLTLDVEYDKYYCSSSSSIGFKLALHSPNESPNVRETGVLLGTGREMKVRIRPEKTETEEHLRTINTKYRHCLFHNEGKLRYFAHYTQRNCEMECVSEMLLKYCGCITHYMPMIYENATVCSIHMLQCVEKIRLRIDPTIESCLDSCLPSCYDLTYLADVFSSQISHDGFEIANQKVENFNHSYAEKSVAVVNMYFKDHSFRSNIQTEFIGISDFLSNVGGVMGLFLGFSFISIAELFYFAILRPVRAFLQVRKMRKFTSTKRNQKSRIPTNFKHGQLPCVRKYIRKRLSKYSDLKSTYKGIQSLKLRTPDLNLDDVYINKELLQSISASLDRNVELESILSKNL